MKDSYKKIVKHYENCLEVHGDSHLGVDWPDPEDAQMRYKVMLDVIKDNSGRSLSLMDFGCGASHLYEYILEQNLTHLKYSGSDISSSYIELSRKKFPKISYYECDIITDNECLPVSDYIICNGVFTEKRELSFDEMWDYFKVMIRLIFNKAKIGIAFNVMSKAVDTERWDLFHLSSDLLIDFMTKELSRKFIIRNDYGLWEYTVYLYK